MKTFTTTLLLLISFSSLFSQEYIKDSKVHLKNNTIVNGDLYLYPSIPDIVKVVDSIGAKQTYQISDIDFIEGQTSIIRNIQYNGEAKLFESVVEGIKISLYKTMFNDHIQLYVLKDNQMRSLDSGSEIVKVDSKTYNKENNKYKGVLKYLISDNNYLFNKVDDIRYNEKDISNIIIAYNNGKISYFKNKETEVQKREIDWKFYSQYSNYTSDPHFSDNTSAISFIQVGGEFFISKNSRHSFKLGIEYGKFEDEIYKSWEKYFNVNINYLYDFYKMPKSNIYIGFRLFDIAKLWNDTENDLYIVPRLSPSLGYEYHVTNNFDLYFEVNHILQFQDIPHNFSIGVSYDI
ncbi:hypothetical protein EO244_06910 [Ancylomarina salipaludis]|uniref:DUF481 domain-containing protein n=1 Tax=Ancylomarina salipaludis TaxID=2501299 RepID=A0A4Q1JM30_9BACT|nr:hypothetical protein [Ancylomarina salipaludis]RXQ95588.1 hypothetical protein EO244_06910 [Ancylomarina salipaludis]